MILKFRIEEGLKKTTSTFTSVVLTQSIIPLIVKFVEEIRRHLGIIKKDILKYYKLKKQLSFQVKALHFV